MSDAIAELLARHPWPAEWASARRLEWLWTVDVPVPPARLWPLIADLSRVNRALDLPRMTFVEKDGQRWGSARYTGMRHEWVEVPWNWVTNRWYELVRIYTAGAMRALYGVYELTELPDGGGTRVAIYYGLVPRSRIFDLGLKWSFGAMGRAYRALLPRVAAEVMAAPDLPPPCLRVDPPPLAPAVAARLEELAATLRARELPPEPIANLVAWMREADDQALERIRVIERARAWGIDEDVLLRVCLHATRAGLLELTWDVVCPHCRGVRDQSTSLDAIPMSGECTACGITFGTDSLEAVEIAFQPHSSIRPIERGVYCSAEPAHKPHIHAQRTVAPGGEAEIPGPREPGKYRLRLRGEMTSSWVVVAEGGEPLATWRISKPPATDTPIAVGATLRLVNDGEAGAIFIVETAAWLEQALRPGKLLSFQDFRDLFSEEYLGSDVRLAVGEQTILFTDLVGSTAMYARRGDPGAFVEVKLHFDKVFALIGKHRGAVVKTIGDAVMAAFNDPVDALACARAIHETFPPAASIDALRLRISINTGPCIAVRLNAAIDYFGHAVNVAAKLQAAAEAWQIAISPTTLAAPGVGNYLADIALEDAPVAVKGVAAPIAAKRWSVFTASAAPTGPSDR